MAHTTEKVNMTDSNQGKGGPHWMSTYGDTIFKRLPQSKQQVKLFFHVYVTYKHFGTQKSACVHEKLKQELS